ncbi:MAG: lysylphosphatidylglycerol synthase domain-containing protein [Nitriliruptorales bacterium]
MNERRHPGDVLRLVGGVAVTVLGGVAAATGRVGQAERDVFRLINQLPHVAVAVSTLGPVMWLATLPALPVLAAVALVARRRFRPALDLVVAGVAASLSGDVVRGVVQRGRPSSLLSRVDVAVPVDTALAYPSGHAAIAAALATAAAPFLPRMWRRVVWALVGMVALGRLYLGAHLPLAVVGGVALGWAVGAAVHLLLGTPGGEVGAAVVKRWLVEHGFGAGQVVPLVGDARSSFPFLASSSPEFCPARGLGQAKTALTPHDLFVKAVSREQRDADLLWKGWRRLIYRDVEDEALFTSAQQQVEHEAAVSSLAVHAGVRSPQVLAVGRLDDGSGVIVQEGIADATGLDRLPAEQLTDERLVDVWRQVARLHEHGIAHRDLKSPNILVDQDGRVWLVDFGFGELDASHRRRARDVAELLASLTVLVGPHRAVAAASTTLSHDQLTVALPYLYPAGLTRPTRKAIRRRRGLLGELRKQVGSATGSAETRRASVTRFGPGTLLTLLMGAFAVHVLLPQVAELGQLGRALSQARWGLLAAGAVMSVLRYPLAAMQQSGALLASLPLGRSSLVQLAAAYANRATPAGLGGAALRERFLERCGIDRPTAIAAIGLVQASGAVVHAAALVVIAAALGDLSAIGHFRVPPRLELLAVVGIGVALVGLVALPFGRRRLLSPLRHASRALVDVLHRPARAALLFAGATGVLVGYAGVLVICVHAFGGDLPITHTLLVYLAGSALASASPTPGGLGALEAALVAGLVSLGAGSGIAVVSVLSFRLLTFWLPIVPGFLAFRTLRRHHLL